MSFTDEELKLTLRDDLPFKDPGGIALSKRGFKRMNDPRKSFTNEDLKHYKESPYEAEIMHEGKFLALLARLEVAEKVANMMYSMPPINPDDGSNKAIADALRAWEKEMGK